MGPAAEACATATTEMGSAAEACATATTEMGSAAGAAASGTGMTTAATATRMGPDEGRGRQ